MDTLRASVKIGLVKTFAFFLSRVPFQIPDQENLSGFSFRGEGLNQNQVYDRHGSEVIFGEKSEI
jgi:hypothetical protein